MNIKELKNMLQNELLKNELQVNFINNLINCKNLNEVRKTIKQNGGNAKIITIKDTDNKCLDGFYMDEITHNSFYFTFYNNDSITDNINRILLFPNKYILQIQYLLKYDNIYKAIKELEYIKRLEKTAKKAKAEYINFMGCMVDKYINTKREEIKSKYFWLFVNMATSMLSNNLETITSLENDFKKVYMLQGEMWAGNNKFKQEQAEIKEIINNNKNKIKSILNNIV